jgi:cell wall-associated NlpC family hydrolase
VKGPQGTVPISSPWKWGLYPFLLAVTFLIAACHSAPPHLPDPPPVLDSSPPVANIPVPDTDISSDSDSDDPEWDGSGGASAIRNRGDALVAVAMSVRGARYRYGGATPAGFDCSGLVFYAHRQLGLTVPRTSRDQAESAGLVKPRKLRRGDLVFFKIRSSRVNHVGIYIGKHRFVHAPGAGKPVTVNSLDDEFYAETFASAGRFWDRLPN